MCLLRGTFYILRSAHTVYLCVLCGPENKQRLFPCTALTDWLVCIAETECVYCAVRSTFYVLPTQCIYVFCVDLRTNSDYFTVQHWMVGFYNHDGVFTARYELSLQTQFRLNFSFQRVIPRDISQNNSRRPYQVSEVMRVAHLVKSTIDCIPCEHSII